MINTKHRGFSLIELLIVVAIILIISAIAVPNLIRAKIAANQASAADSLRTLDSVSTNYYNTYDDGYPGSLSVLGPAGAGGTSCNLAGMIDSNLASGSKSGYSFTWVVGGSQLQAPANGCGAAGYSDMFSVTASPYGFPTGTTYYCVDATGVIRSSSTAITAGTTGCPLTAMAIGEQ